MKAPKTLLVVAGSLVVAAGVLIAVSCIPSSAPEPEYVCAQNGQPSSGFKDTKKNCPITSESLKGAPRMGKRSVRQRQIHHAPNQHSITAWSYRLRYCFANC